MKTSELNRKSMPVGYFGVATEGAFWNVGLAAANKIVTLVGQVVLAWLLAPSDMGLAGMAIAMVGFTAFVSGGGISDVLIQRNRYEKEVGQGLWLSIIFAVIAFVLVSGMAPIMEWFGRGQLFGLLIVLAFAVALEMPNSILGGRLKNHLDFKHLAIANFIGGVVYTCAALVLARLGFGPYSLVLPILPRTLSISFYMIWIEGIPPFERPRFKLIKAFMEPVISLALTGFFVGLQTQAPIFFVGLVLSPTATGHFTWGWSVASQAVFLLAVNLRHVLMPIFSKMEDAKERQVLAVYKTAKAMVAILTVACGLQALVAQPLLDRLFPTKWYPSGPVIVWLSLGLIFQGIWISASSWLNASGKYRELLIVSAITAILAGSFAYFGALSNGAEGAAIGTSIGLTLGFVFSLSHLPSKEKGKNLMGIFSPLLISLTLWAGCYYMILKYSLEIKAFSVLAFLAGSILIWWKWDDGTLRKLFSKICLGRSV